ncbi:DUF2235 domain-containing protein [Nioella sp.]|uniref:DUF2235 domain-containing protein n=1 Tax=Nioella sp. TaxID=1912091 RepID=UPI003B520CB6
MAPIRGKWSFWRGFRNEEPRLPDVRPACTHVVLLDGTMSTLRRGQETNVGLTYRLLSELPQSANVMLYYEPGIQWRGVKRSVEVLAGVGINRQIKRAYLFLARNYHPGDRIFLMGYSRGAFAVRSLAGLIDKLGLLRPAQISEDALERLYCLYQEAPDSQQARAFRASRCHDRVRIEMVGVYDTVRALGLRWPLLWRLAPQTHEFHSHELGASTRHGRHALAMDETRDVYAPVMWTLPEGREGDVIQMWFRGTHGDVGGQLGDWQAARPLANIPLAWMLGEAEHCGLPLPPHWRSRYLTDPGAPSVGTMRGWSRIFVLRHKRRIGLDRSERVHPSALPAARQAGLPVMSDGALRIG